MGAWNPTEARSDFSRVIELDSNLEATCKKELKKLDDMEKEKNEADKERLKKLF